MQKRLLSLVCLTLILMVALAPITAAAERTKIVFMFRGGKLQSELVNFWKEDFEQKNPDIEVEWREATGNWMDQIPVWVATGVGPDVFETWGNAASSWGENGVSLDLNPYVARDFTAQEINDFYPIYRFHNIS